jgi:ABC-type antimicrobial peptide transport system permease subunit
MASPDTKPVPPVPHPAPREASWDIEPLRLRPALVLSMAWNSLRIRATRSVLTLLTLAVAVGFLHYLLLQPSGTGLADRSARNLMLVLALLVAAAGVVSTMLTTVTQRYREIGTLKCLGALDAFILYSVMAEATLLGLAGALAGVLLGLVFALLVALAEAGSGFLGHLAWAGWWWKALASCSAGTLLAMLGAVVPAFLASRLPPMDAMRGDK